MKEAVFQRSGYKCSQVQGHAPLHSKVNSGTDAAAVHTRVHAYMCNVHVRELHVSVGKESGQAIA